MKALTVRQPYAWAIIHGGKTIENRSQVWHHRGPVAIHAGLAPFQQHNDAARAHRAAHGTETPTELAFGAVIGVVDVVDVHRTTPGCCTSPWADGLAGTHLVLARPRPLRVPVRATGHLGLWTLTDDDCDAVTANLPRETRR